MDQDEKNLLMDLIVKALEKLDKTTESIDSRLDNIDITMAKNTISLDEHIKRTNLIEQKIQNDIEPAINFYNGLIFLGKVIGILALIVTILGGTIELFKFLIKG